MNSTTLKAISTNKLLKNVDIDDIDFSPFNGVLKIVREGDIIYRHGEEADNIYLIIKGKVNLIPQNSDHIEMVSLENDDFFGHREILDETDRKDSAIASIDSYLISFGSDEFNRLLDISSQIKINAGVIESIEFNEHANEESENFDDGMSSIKDFEHYDEGDDDSNLSETLNEEISETMETEEEESSWLEISESDAATEIFEPPFKQGSREENPETTSEPSLTDDDVMFSLSGIESEDEISSAKPDGAITEEPDDVWSGYQDEIEKESDPIYKETVNNNSEPSDGSDIWNTMDEEFDKYTDDDSLEFSSGENDFKFDDKPFDKDSDKSDQFEKRELVTSGGYVESTKQQGGSLKKYEDILEELPGLFADAELTETLKHSLEIFNGLTQPDDTAMVYSEVTGGVLKYIMNEKCEVEELDSEDASAGIPDFIDSSEPIALRSHEFNKELIPAEIRTNVENIEGLLYIPLHSKDKGFTCVLILISESREFTNADIDHAKLIAGFCRTAISNSIRTYEHESEIRKSAFEGFKKIISENVKQPLLLSERFAVYLTKLEADDSAKATAELMLESLAAATERLLYYEEIGADKSKKHLVKIHLNQLIKNAADELESLFIDSNIKLSMDLQKGLMVKVFPSDLKICFIELLKNACESFDFSGTIKITSKNKDGTA